MLMNAVESYLAVRRAAGFELGVVEVLLRSFARHAATLGERFVRSQTAIDWAGMTRSPQQKQRRLGTVIRFARHMRAENSRHEIPPDFVFAHHRHRSLPFIFKASDIQRLIQEASCLAPKDPLLRHSFKTLFALLVATGLRISEALALRLDDISTEGLLIHKTKFRKSRLVPLHETVMAGLQRYLARRRHFAGSNDHLFVSARGGVLRYGYVRKTFRKLVRDIDLDSLPGRPRPQIHGFRHTFAVRALETSPDGRDRIAQHMLALSTYLGHAHVADTYWYLQATPRLMEDIACASERFAKGESR